MARLDIVAEPGKQEIITTRVFNAPRDLVFKAYNDPELIPQWWGPRGYTTRVDKMELKPGGLWRYVQSNGDGQEFAFSGVCHSVNAPEQMISTFEFEGMPGHVLLGTMTFEERDGKTFFTERLVFQTVEDRDGMIQSGMEEGSADSMERFEELLEKLQTMATRS